MNLSRTTFIIHRLRGQNQPSPDPPKKIKDTFLSCLHYQPARGLYKLLVPLVICLQASIVDLQNIVILITRQRNYSKAT